MRVALKLMAKKKKKKIIVLIHVKTALFLTTCDWKNETSKRMYANYH